MPAPSATYTELRDMLHSVQVGSTLRGFTLQSRTALDAGRGLYTITVTRQSNTWTCVYIAAPDGSVGRILKVVDQTGRQWAPAPWVDGWLDAGIG